MKKIHIEKEWIYKDLGFPVLLRNVPMRKFRGDLILDINYKDLQRTVLGALAYYPGELTGDHIRFIRLWMQLTLQEFADRLGVTHPAVIKWEKAANKPAKITLMAQRELRLLILDELLKDDRAFRNAYRKITTLDFSASGKPIEIDTDQMAI